MDLVQHLGDPGVNRSLGGRDLDLGLAGTFLPIPEQVEPGSRTPLHPAALASVPYGIVLVRVRVAVANVRVKQ